MTGATDPLVSIDLVAASSSRHFYRISARYVSRPDINPPPFFFWLRLYVRGERTRRMHERTYAMYARGRNGIVSLSRKRARVRTPKCTRCMVVSSRVSRENFFGIFQYFFLFFL